MVYKHGCLDIFYRRCIVPMLGFGSTASLLYTRKIVFHYSRCWCMWSKLLYVMAAVVMRSVVSVSNAFDHVCMRIVFHYTRCWCMWSKQYRVDVGGHSFVSRSRLSKHTWRVYTLASLWAIDNQSVVATIYRSHLDFTASTYASGLCRMARRT